MPPTKVNPAPKPNNFWQPLGNGREGTQSPPIIDGCLARLKSKRILLNLLHPDYESGGTILVGYNHRQLEIDRPVDWPGTSNRVRVLFRDNAKVWNYFTVDVIGATDDTLIVQCPQSLYRLQRRTHFRVETARGSEASFVHNETALAKVCIEDLSAGGMQLCANTRLGLLAEDKINAISILIPGGDPTGDKGKPQDLSLHIQQGRVARATEEEGKFFYGIAFDCSHQEEMLLLRYVRRRELELLRKGLMNEY